MHIYLVKSRIDNRVIFVFGSLDDSVAYNMMEDFCFSHHLYYLERVLSYTTGVVNVDKKE